METGGRTDLRRAPRVYHEGPLAAGRDVALTAAQAHYLRNVMRLAEGDVVRLFNGRDGEWACVLTALKKKAGAARCA